MFNAHQLVQLHKDVQLALIILFCVSRGSISHNVHGGPVHPRCAEGGRIIQLPLHDETSLHIRDQTEQQCTALCAR